MKFYLKHILIRKITTNICNCLVINFCIETFPEAILIFVKEKKEDFKGSFPDYTLPTFTTYKLLKNTCIFGELFCLQVKGTNAIELEKKK